MCTSVSGYSDYLNGQKLDIRIKNILAGGIHNVCVLIWPAVSLANSKVLGKF